MSRLRVFYVYAEARYAVLRQEKNFPSVKFPPTDTLSHGGLYDVYDAVTSKMKEKTLLPIYMVALQLG